MTPVVFPDVELWACDYLRTALADPTVFVGNLDGTSTDSKRVIVRRDGGGQRSPVTETARLGVRTFGPNEQASTDLARQVYALLLACAGNGPVRRALGISGPSAVTDPAGPMRYLTVELTVRGAPA